VKLGKIVAQVNMHQCHTVKMVAMKSFNKKA